MKNVERKSKLRRVHVSLLKIRSSSRNDKPRLPKLSRLQRPPKLLQLPASKSKGSSPNKPPNNFEHKLESGKQS
jgi:hypothetical protein